MSQIITHLAPLTPAQQALFDAHVGAVRIMVRSYCHRKGIVRDFDDLNQAALLALASCARSFDPSQGFKFLSYYGYRVRGAIKDELRRFDLLTRSHRKQMRAEGVEQPTETAFSVLNGNRELYLHIDQALTSPAQDATPLELQEEIDRALVGFSATERTILMGYYGECLPLRMIGERLDVSESHICQTLTALRKRLRARHGGEAVPDKRPDRRMAGTRG